MNTYSKYVVGGDKYPKNIIISCTKVMSDFGWSCVVPNSSNKDAERIWEKISEFFNRHLGSKTRAYWFHDAYCLYKMNSKKQITQAMVIATLRIADRVVCIIEYMAVKKELQVQGLGR